jgi:hypothetical protein
MRNNTFIRGSICTCRQVTGLAGMLFMVLGLCAIPAHTYSQQLLGRQYMSNTSTSLERVIRHFPQTNAIVLQLGKSRSFRTGERYKIEVILTNRSADEIYFVTSFEVDDFFLEVKDTKGKDMPLSESAKSKNKLPKSRRNSSMRLAPKEEYVFHLDLRELFDLKVGKYRLFISRPVYKKDKQTVVTAVMKPTEISITK